MNKFWTRGLTACLFAIAASAAFAAHAQSEGPDVLVKKTSEEVLSIIRSDKEIQKGNTTRIAQLIEDKVAPHFDFARMTRLAVGRSWREATDEQKAALTREFRTLLVRSYAAAFTAYTHIAMEYRPFRMNPGDKEAVVQTLIKLPGGAPPVAVDYDMESTDDGWKVYDVRVAGASLIINYRNLFAQEIQNGGLDGLLKSLVEKNKARPVAAKQ
jgi:phospholipid transport system substrate-binding protein